MTVKTSDTISKEHFHVQARKKHNLNRITVYWLYASLGHSQKGRRQQTCEEVLRTPQMKGQPRKSGDDTTLGATAKMLEEKVEKLSVEMGWHLLRINYNMLQFSCNTQTL